MKRGLKVDVLVELVANHSVHSMKRGLKVSKLTTHKSLNHNILDEKRIERLTHLIQTTTESTLYSMKRGLKGPIRIYV